LYWLLEDSRKAKECSDYTVPKNLLKIAQADNQALDMCALTKHNVTESLSRHRIEAEISQDVSLLP
jgi:hypothetical protein